MYIEPVAKIVTLAGLDATGFTTYASGGSATPVQWTKISNVKSYSGFDGSASEIERTNFDSTAKEFILGLFDPGAFSIEVDQDNSDAGQLALMTALVTGVYQCAACGQTVHICRACDRGNRYCAGVCAPQRRRESLRRAAARYQRSRRGATRHAARQSALRARQIQIVTHQGCSCAGK